MFFRVTLPFAAANFMNQCARTIMAIVGPVLAVEFGLSASELGLLAACMFASYAAAQLPLGVALDKFGPRRMQASLMSFAALGFAVFALSSSFAGLATARVMLGVGISAGLMAVIKANADWFPPSRVAAMTGIAMGIGGLGSAMTTAPVQAILPVVGWRGVFWGLAACTIAAAAWIWFFVPDKPRSTPARAVRDDVMVTVAILRSPVFWRLGPAVAALAMLNFAYLGLWAGPWLRDVAGMDGPARANLLFLYTLSMMAGSVVTGNLASRATAAGLPPFLVPVVGCAMTVLMQVGLMLQPTSGPAVMALWLVMAFFGASGPAAYIAVGQLFPREQTGRVASAVNMFTLGFAFLLQAAIGWILDLWPRTAAGGWDPDGYSWALAVSALLQSLAAVAMASARRR